MGVRKKIEPWMIPDLCAVVSRAPAASAAAMPAKGSPLHYFAIGGAVHPLEWPLFYVLFPVLAFFAMPDEATRALFRSNLVLQLCVFLPIVQLPALVTSRMAYVDIGWPCGLVAMGYAALSWGSGWWLRRWIVSGLIMLHGGRMFIGALLLFYPYRFDKDLQRYRYARQRWAEQDGMPARGLPWGFKIQHDTLQQCFANSVLLAMPVLLPASNPSPVLEPLEVVGWTIWVGGWLFENAADLQKSHFVAEVQKRRKALKEASADGTGGAEAARLLTVTLGYKPFDGAEYRLWTLCRHPNYFGEWCCWLGLVVSSEMIRRNFYSRNFYDTDCFGSQIGAFPSLLGMPNVEDGMLLLYAVALLYALRMFYDCLIHWTGAGPAEYYSYQKRGAAGYGEYQQTTRCFWPFPLPESLLLSHFQQVGWPAPDVSIAERSKKRF
jgi:steroid 5-alpha reductase family enzyme